MTCDYPESAGVLAERVALGLLDGVMSQLASKHPGSRVPEPVTVIAASAMPRSWLKKERHEGALEVFGPMHKGYAGDQIGPVWA